MIIQIKNFFEEWPSIAEELKRAMTYSKGDIELSDIYLGLLEGRYQLWSVDSKGFAVTTVIQYPQKRVLHILALAGKDIIRNLSNDLPFITYIKKQFGVTKLEASCRESMLKLIQRYSWKLKYHTVEFDLGDK